MAREVNGTQPYSDKLVKLIPSEIIGAYMVLSNILGYTAGNMQASALPKTITESDLKPVLLQVVFFVLLILTPVYLKKISKVNNITQLIVTTFSFIIWVYTLGGPFIVWGIYYSIIGSVVLVLWSVIIPLFVAADIKPSR
jgi:MFS superfamily sulfate permease-like transporter